MLNYLYEIGASAYTQVVILFLLLAYFFTHRKDPRHIASGLSLIRTVILLLIFLYFLWNWSSEIPPSLRTTSVLGMFVINLFLLKNVILSRWERPYRDALKNYGLEPTNKDHLDQVWRKGKRFYYARYLLTSLFSGGSPRHFLHGMAAERIHADIQATLAQYGMEKQLVTLKMLTTFLKNRLAHDDSISMESKEAMEQAIAKLSHYGWLEKQSNEFLYTVIEAPENLHRPEWAELRKKAGEST